MKELDQVKKGINEYDLSLVGYSINRRESISMGLMKMGHACLNGFFFPFKSTFCS